MTTNTSTAKQRDDAPVSLTMLAEMKQKGRKIVCLTAYDASFAARVDEAGVDVVLVGDTLGMVVQGRDSTVPVTVDDMVYHSRMVARGLHRAFLMADMPFLSYATPEAAVRNAAALMQQGGAKMIKLEGGEAQAELVAFLTGRGIPVCAHIGLRPQFVHKLGGYRVQGREGAAAEAILRDARALCDAGADILLLECIPGELGQRVTAMSPVPVIGIGAGPGVDGQILVLYDMLDITVGHKPRFVRNFMAGADSPARALRAYVEAVRDGSFPGPEHTF